MTSLYSKVVRSMRKFTFKTMLPQPYRRHIEVLQCRMRKDNRDEVIKELIDRELSSCFSPV